MSEEKKQACTENVVLIREHGQIIGLISRAVVYGCERLDSEDIAKLIDPDFGVINRTVEKEGGV